MANPQTPNEAQLTWVFSGSALASGAAVTTLGVQWITAVEDVLDVATLLWDDLRPALNSNLVLDEITLKRGPSNTGLTYVRPVGLAGTTGPDGVPSNVAMLVRKSLSNISQRFGGRMYWPGLPESEVDSAGTIDPAFLTGLQTSFNALFDGLDGLGATPLVISSTVSDPRPIASLQVQPRVATQRRRLRR